MKLHFLTLKDAEVLVKKGYLSPIRNWQSNWQRITYWEKTDKCVQLTGNSTDLKIFWDDLEKNKTIDEYVLKNKRRFGIRHRHSLVYLMYENTKEYWKGILYSKKNFKRIVIL